MPTLAFWLAYLLFCFAVGLSVRDGLDSWLWLLAISVACLLAACFLPNRKEGEDAPTT